MGFRILFALIILAAPLSASEPKQVVFSELMWMGSNASSADEWIELYNSSDAEIDLSGWTISRLTADGEKIMLQIEGGRIAPHATFLISNYPPDNSQSMLAVEPQHVSSAIALPNTKLQLRLYNGNPEENADLMDVADDGKGAPLAGDTKLKRAMVRLAFDQSGTLATSWGTARETSGWDEGATELGTPGSIPEYLQVTSSGEQTATDVQSASWAVLKTNFAGE